MQFNSAWLFKQHPTAPRMQLTDPENEKGKAAVSWDLVSIF